MILEKLATESIQKKRFENKKKGLENLILRKKISKKILKSKERRLLSAESLINGYKKKRQLKSREKRLARKEGKFFVPSREKVFFVIRIKGINGVPPNIRKILHLIRLRQINNGVFLKVNTSTVRMLKKIEPFIAYGYPSVKSIRKLLTNRGFGKIGKRGEWKRVSLLDEGIIEQVLVDHGISNIEEVINEIYEGGSHFKEVNNFLWPFKLKSPKKGFSKFGKTIHVSEKGACGNWEEGINHLIFKMV